MPYHSKWQDLPTEAINPDTLGIDKMPVSDIVDLFSAEDRRVVSAVHKERERIAHGVEIIVGALKKGGRILLVGAGTSGRLGVVEAAEMPPTFGTSPLLVQAIMAGGQDAVFRAREGVEDNFEEGARSVARLRVSKRDVIIGVSASGITQFVRGALTGARKKHARIIFVTCWPKTELQNFVDLIIAPSVGPEVIAGSTRLKAGTATKMVLNMLTTIAMIRVGKTYGNLMVDVQTGSEKLKDRAKRIVAIDDRHGAGRGGRTADQGAVEREGRDRHEKSGSPLRPRAPPPPRRRRLDSRRARGRPRAAAYSVSVIFFRPRGASGDNPRTSASASAQSCPGTIAAIGDSHSVTPRATRSGTCAAESASSRSEITTSGAFRLRATSMNSIMSRTIAPSVATMMMGSLLSIMATGPCRKSGSANGCAML